MNKILEYIVNAEEIEPETLSQQFPDLSSKDRQKILALSVLKTTRYGYEDMDVFENLCLTINDIEPNIKTMQGVEPRHVWWFFEVISKIFKDLPEFSDEVIEYIKQMHIDKGYKFYPLKMKDIDNTYLNDVITRAEEGPFPLNDDDPDDIQAIKYLYIQEYLKAKREQLRNLSSKI